MELFHNSIYCSTPLLFTQGQDKEQRMQIRQSGGVVLRLAAALMLLVSLGAALPAVAVPSSTSTAA